MTLSCGLGARCAWVICASLAWGCSGEERCQFAGDFGHGTLIDYRADAIQIVNTGSVPKLFVFGGRTWQWHSLLPDGHITSMLGRSTLDLYEGAFQARTVFPWDSGFRVIAGWSSKYVEADKSVEEREFVWTGSQQLGRARVGQTFWVRGDLYVTYSALENSGPPEVWVGGLARLDRDDHLTPLGAPFLRYTRTNMKDGRELTLMTGAWDEENGYFLIDEHEDDLYFRIAKVHKVALDGTALGVETVAGDAPYLNNWIKLKNGRWAGVHGSNWLWFTPTERWRDPSRRYPLPSGTTTQGRDADGNLWLAGTENDELITHRWDENSERLTDPVRSPLPVKTCVLLLGLD